MAARRPLAAGAGRRRVGHGGQPVGARRERAEHRKRLEAGERELERRLLRSTLSDALRGRTLRGAATRHGAAGSPRARPVDMDLEWSCLDVDVGIRFSCGTWSWTNGPGAALGGDALGPRRYRVVVDCAKAVLELCYLDSLRRTAPAPLLESSPARSRLTRSASAAQPDRTCWPRTTACSTRTSSSAAA